MIYMKMYGSNCCSTLPLVALCLQYVKTRVCQHFQLTGFAIDSIFRPMLPYNTPPREEQYFGKFALKVDKFNSRRMFRYSNNNVINVMGGD